MENISIMRYHHGTRPTYLSLKCVLIDFNGFHKVGHTFHRFRAQWSLERRELKSSLYIPVEIGYRHFRPARQSSLKTLL